MAFGEITLGKSLCLKTFWSLFWCVTGCRDGGERERKWERLDVGGGVASFSSKLKCIHPTHPSATTDLFFSYYLIALSLWRAGGEGEGNGRSGLKTNSLKNVGTKWKEAYSHGGSVSCHWPLRRAGIMCLWGFHKGYSFLDLGTRHEELPLARLGHHHPPNSKKKKNTHTHLHPPKPSTASPRRLLVAIGRNG